LPGIHVPLSCVDLLSSRNCIFCLRRPFARRYPYLQRTCRGLAEAIFGDTQRLDLLLTVALPASVACGQAGASDAARFRRRGGHRPFRPRCDRLFGALCSRPFHCLTILRVSRLCSRKSARRGRETQRVHRTRGRSFAGTFLAAETGERAVRRTG